EYNQFQAEFFVVDNPMVCPATLLSIPVENITIKIILILRSIWGFVFGYEKPNGIMVLRSENTCEDCSIYNPKLSFQGFSSVKLSRCKKI
ncbi:MAG: hypothetical protein D6770_07970, partial [Anaerolineae bacterium]